MAFEPLQIAVGGALGFVTAGVLRWWQYRRDLWLARVEHFCKTVELTADVASEYWLHHKGQRLETSDQKFSVSKLESQLLGLQIRLDGMFVTFCDRFSDASKSHLEILMSNFTETLTGGAYHVRVRTTYPEQSRLAQVIASDIIVYARSAVDQAVTFNGWLMFIRDRKRRRDSELPN